MILPLVVVLLHAVVGLGLTVAATPIQNRSKELLFCMCLLVSQASLLGIWAASTTPRLNRGIALFCAAAILALEMGFAAKVNPAVAILLIFVPLACLGGGLYAARRHLQIQLRLADSGQVGATAQFSISQLLALTATVAACIALVQWLAKLSPVIASAVPMVRIPIDEYLLDMASFSLCVVPVAMSCVWSVLGSQRVWARGTLLLAAPVAAGMIPAIYRVHRAEWWVYILAAYVMELAIGLTLLAARLCHYRLVRRTP